MEREQLQAESTLVVTGLSAEEFHDDVTANIEGPAAGDTADSTLSFTCYGDLLETLTPRTLELIGPSATTSQSASTRQHGSSTGT